jgi:hypothetical protein
MNVGSDCQSSRHPVAINWVIPPEIVIIVVTSTWTVVTTAVARPIVIATITWPIRAAIGRPIGTVAARPTGKAIVNVGAAVKASAWPVVVTASRGAMMKPIADVSFTAKTSAADVSAATATAATTAAATAAPPRVAVINDYD